MPLTPEDDLTIALNTVAVVNDVAVGPNNTGDNWLFRNTTTGQFAFGGNVWSLFRESLDQIGGSQGLVELGLI